MHSTSPWLALSVVVMAGCTGKVVGPAERSPTDVNVSVSVGTSRLRRLTRSEYQNMVQDLLGGERPDAALLPEDARYTFFKTTSGQPLSASEAVK